MKEIWKEIIGYEGLYSVSNTGLVKRVTTNKIKYPSLNSWGYKVVSLSKSNTKLKTVLVHRLVAIHFIDNPENKKQVNHIDGIKTNNNVSNLEWNTQHENMTHAFKTGLNSNIKFLNKEIEKQYSHSDLVDNKLCYGENSKLRREQIGSILRIGYYNSKQLLNALNNFNISREIFDKAIKELNYIAESRYKL